MSYQPKLPASMAHELRQVAAEKRSQYKPGAVGLIVGNVCWTPTGVALYVLRLSDREPVQFKTRSISRKLREVRYVATRYRTADVAYCLVRHGDDGPVILSRHATPQAAHFALEDHRNGT